jgi:hypothetical protein
MHFLLCAVTYIIALLFGKIPNIFAFILRAVARRAALVVKIQRGEFLGKGCAR